MKESQITHIRKPNVYSSVEHITHVKIGPNIHPVSQIIDLLQARKYKFYVSRLGVHSWVHVVEPAGRRAYIRTGPDANGEKRDNLLSLPPC